MAYRLKRTPDKYNFDTLEFDIQILPKHFSPLASRDIKFVVVHHMTIPGKGNGSALDACYSTWQKREASAHYGIDGKLIRQFVWDKDFAWATANNYGNLHGLSNEHANKTLGPKWEIDVDTWMTGAKLAAYQHKYCKLGRPTSTGFGTGGTLRTHESFYNTACPGPFFRLIWTKYAVETQRIYDEIMNIKPPTPKPPVNKPTTYKVVGGDTLWKISNTFNVSVANLAKWNKISQPFIINIGQMLTLVEPKNSPTPVNKPTAFWLGEFNVTSPTYSDSPGSWTSRSPKLAEFIKESFGGCSIYSLHEMITHSQVVTFSNALGNKFKHNGSIIGNDIYTTKSKYKILVHRTSTKTFYPQKRGYTLCVLERDGKRFNVVSVHGPNKLTPLKFLYAKWIVSVVKNWKDPTIVVGDYNHAKHYSGSLASALNKIGFKTYDDNYSIDKISVKDCSVTELRKIPISNHLSTHDAYQYRIELP